MADDKTHYMKLGPPVTRPNLPTACGKGSERYKFVARGNGPVTCDDCERIYGQDLEKIRRARKGGVLR